MVSSPSVAPAFPTSRDRLARVLGSALTLSACQPLPTRDASDLESDSILVGVALAQGEEFPDDFCINNLSVPDPEGKVCDFVSVVDGANYNFIDGAGGVNLANNFNGQDVFVYQLPIEFDLANTLEFEGIPEGWFLYPGPSEFDPITKVNLKIPSMDECVYHGEGHCRFPLKPEQILVLKNETDGAVE